MAGPAAAMVMEDGGWEMEDGGGDKMDDEDRGERGESANKKVMVVYTSSKKESITNSQQRR